MTTTNRKPPRILDAIDYYNRNRKPNQSEMTKQSLAALILPNHSKKTATFYLTRWVKGFELTKLQSQEICLISKITGVSIDYLLNQSKKKTC